jgi:hypothetical protein
MSETDGTTSRLWRRQLPCGSSFHFRQTLGDNLDFSVDPPTEDRQMPTAGGKDTDGVLGLRLGSVDDMMRPGILRSFPLWGPTVLILVRTKHLYGHKLPLCRLTRVEKVAMPAESFGACDTPHMRIDRRRMPLDYATSKVRCTQRT